MPGVHPPPEIMPLHAAFLQEKEEQRQREEEEQQERERQVEEAHQQAELVYCVNQWASVSLDRQRQKTKSGTCPLIAGETTMSIAASQLKEIRQEFAKLKPAPSSRWT